MAQAPRVPRQGTNPTIESVAEHARVSRQTVSNALNAPERVKTETLTRVLASIETLGYRPNHAARTLRTQSTRLIACRLLPQAVQGSGGVHDAFLHALCAAARDRGYDVLSFAAATDDAEIAVFDDLLRRNAVDAFVLFHTHFVDPRPAFLLERSAPFVSFGRPWGQPGTTHSWVDVDGAVGMAAAVDHLADQGHRRIAFLGWPDSSGVGSDRKRGWASAMRRRRLSTRGLHVSGEEGIAAGSALAGALLDSDEPPTALVCVSDAMAVGAMQALEVRGLSPGPDVAVVGFDDSVFAGVVKPGLTSLRQPLEAVAEKVVEILLQHMNGAPTEPTTVLIPPVLVVRGSSVGSPRP